MKDFTIFESLLKLLSKDLVQKGVEHYGSDAYYKRCKTWDHLLVLMYGQIKGVKSLRDLTLSLDKRSWLGKLGRIKTVKKSTISDANNQRDPQVFFWLAQQLMALLPRKQKQEVKEVVRLLDSSPIQLKGLGYEWAHATKTLRCQGLKLHVEYDLGWGAPQKIVVSAANVDDCKMGQTWPLSKETIYVFDKGYYDFNWWWSIHKQSSYFVTRLKDNAAVFIIEQREIAETTTILEDQLVHFKKKCPRGGKKNLYEGHLRRVVVKREEGKKPLVLITNIEHLSAEEIASLYKDRWKIELFFKWIKQNLKMKKFLGQSANAVLIQIAVALITYMLIFLFQKQFKKNWTLRQTLIWVSHQLHQIIRWPKAVAPPTYPCLSGQILCKVQI